MKEAFAWMLLAATLLVGCGSQVRSAEGSASPASEAKADMAATELASNVKVQTQRQIIRNGSITLRVKNLGDASQSALNLVKGLGGYVEAESTGNLASEHTESVMTVRVPVAKFDELLGKLEGVGVVLYRSQSAKDVTTEIADMGARLKVMRAQEEVYIGLLKQARSLKDSMAVHEQIMRLREEIESMDAQLKSVSELAALSTLEIRLLSETLPLSEKRNQGWAQEAVTRNSNTLQSALIGLGQFGIFVAFMAPFWVPVAAVGWWVWKGARKSGAKAPKRMD